MLKISGKFSHKKYYMTLTHKPYFIKSWLRSGANIKDALLRLT
jgi:hypothetical protein